MLETDTFQYKKELTTRQHHKKTAPLLIYENRQSVLLTHAIGIISQLDSNRGMANILLKKGRCIRLFFRMF